MNKLTFRLFLLTNMPIAFIAGIRLHHASTNEAAIQVKHHWFSQNPFRSIYFAVLAMAAEISTGLLVMQALRKNSGSFSMLVTHQTAAFHKKATGKIIFTCSGGPKITQTLSTLTQPNDTNTLELLAVGTNQQGDIVAEFTFTWSIKRKS